MFKSISQWDYASLAILSKSVISGQLLHALHPNGNPQKKKNT